MKLVVFGGACLIASAILLAGGILLPGIALGIVGLVEGFAGAYGGKNKDN